MVDQVSPAQANVMEQNGGGPQEDSDMSYGNLYDAEYYQKSCGPIPYDRSEPQWSMVFGRIADELIRSLKPQRVFDAGCAMGFLVEAFWDRGVHAWGVDISPYAIANVRRDMKPYCRVGSITEPLSEKYDLITCIEVLEHMPESDSAIAIGNLTSATDTILFSSTPFDLNEPTHFNVRPTISWLEIFQDHGFSPDILYDASFVAPHAILLRRRAALPNDVLRAFADLVRLRHVCMQRENGANDIAAQLGSVRAALESARAEAAQARESAHDAAHLRATLAASEQQIAELRVQLDNERKQNEMLRHIQQRLTVEVDHLRELTQSQQRQGAEPRVDSGLDSRSAADGGKQHMSAEANQSELYQRIAYLDRRIADHDRAIHSLAWRLGAIMQSRTWRILTRAGGILLRLSGQKQ